ncbi:hypothetical protein [Wolbachia endosymbiont of Pentalonia nigronervosa]|jgi:site-specific DNA recombinase|uniref:hypothetical protein n=1 Tax=Wolbachia endosymbiont of Pentalonia nigronervosa TaxID=1301914 RepID=UPI0034E21627
MQLNNLEEEIQIKNGEISFFVQLKLKKTPGRCIILEPENKHSRSGKKNNILLKALVRAHLWQRQLNEGKYANMVELCIANNMEPRSMYLRAVLRLNFLAPKIKEDILNGMQPRYLKWTDFKKGIPLLWSEQFEKFYYV